MEAQGLAVKYMGIVFLGDAHLIQMTGVTALRADGDTATPMRISPSRASSIWRELVYSGATAPSSDGTEERRSERWPPRLGSSGYLHALHAIRAVKLFRSTVHLSSLSPVVRLSFLLSARRLPFTPPS